MNGDVYVLRAKLEAYKQMREEDNKIKDLLHRKNLSLADEVMELKRKLRQYDGPARG